MEATTTKPGAPAGRALPDAPPAAADEKKGPPRALVFGIGAIVVLVALFYGIKFLLFAFSHESTDDAKIDADQYTVTSKIAERVDQVLVDTNQQVKKGQLLIRLDSRDEAQRVNEARATRDALLAQAKAAEANLAYVRDQVTAQVQQGQGAVEQANAGVASAADQANAARRQITVARAASDAADQQLRAAEAGVPAARANADKADADLRRAQSLASTGDISQAELDAAKASQAAAAAALQQALANERAAAATLEESNAKLAGELPTSSSARQQISVQQGTLTTAQGKLAEAGSPNRVIAQQAQVAAAEADAATASAQLKTAQDQYSYTEIHAPIDGYIGAKNVDVGTTVSPGQSLLVIVPLHRVYVTANFKETQLGKLKVGQPAEITIDAYKGVTFAGHVDAIAPASQNTFSLVPAQNATGNFVKVTQRVPVRILFDNPDPNYALRAGMSVEAAVKVK